MVRLNLQLFAVATSIVDYLNKQGQDSSFSARQKLATQYGISNYTGTAEQNSQLLKTLQSGTKPTTTKTSGTTTTKTTTSTPPKGVDQATWDKANSEFKVSSAYTQTMTKVQELIDKINSGKTSYTDQVKGLMEQIQGREKFSYDVDSDTMFQQYLSSMMGMGQTAMQDTMGQATALTGGYGSSYAQSVGNQAYNQYIQTAYDNLPEFYNMARDTYQMESDDLYRQYSMLSEQDAQEYARTMDAWTVNNTSAQQLYEQEWNKFQDDKSTASNSVNWLNSDYWSQQSLEEQQKSRNQSQSQFIAQNDLNGDGKVDSKDHDLAYQRSITSSSSSGGSGGSGSDVRDANESLKKVALEARKKGALYYSQWIDEKADAGFDVASLNSYVETYYEKDWVEKGLDKVKGWAWSIFN